MKYFVLFATLVLAVHAGPTCKCEETSKVKTFAIDINERGTTFTQKVTLDYENNWALFTVPQHNTVEQQDILFDLNTHLVATLPSAGGFCLVDSMPGDFPSLEELAEGFTQVQNPNARVTSMEVTETYQRVLSEPVQERTSLGPKMAEFCSQKPIFHVETIEFASGQGIVNFPSGGNDTTPVPPKNVGGQSLATRADPCHPVPGFQVNCLAISWSCCGVSNHCIYRYTCSSQDQHQCTGRHSFTGSGWNCVPVGPGCG